MPTQLDGLTYEVLFNVLRAHGFREASNARARVFVHDATEAELILPKLPDSEFVRSFHYGAARAAMSDYNIMTRDAFDLALLQVAHRMSAATV